MTGETDVREGGDPTLALLHEARARERAQTRRYRRLAALAEDAGDGPLAERLNELHADEQHHLSRVTARILELGGRPEETPAGPATLELAGWEEAARAIEGEEVAFYEGALERRDLDARTRAILEQILESERRHRDVMGGKWMSA